MHSTMLTSFSYYNFETKSCTGISLWTVKRSKAVLKKKKLRKGVVLYREKWVLHVRTWETCRAMSIIEIPYGNLEDRSIRREQLCFTFAIEITRVREQKRASKFKIEFWMVCGWYYSIFRRDYGKHWMRKLRR